MNLDFQKYWLFSHCLVNFMRDVCGWDDKRIIRELMGESELGEARKAQAAEQ